MASSRQAPGQSRPNRPLAQARHCTPSQAVADAVPAAAAAQAATPTALASPDPRRAMLARGVASGELPPDLDVDRALDALLGPVFYRALVAGGPIAPVFTDRLVAEVLG